MCRRAGRPGCPADELHLEVRVPAVLVDVEDLDNVGMLEPGDGLGLGDEAEGGLAPGVRTGQDHLQRDRSI